MNRISSSWRFLAGFSVLAVAVVSADGDDKPPRRPADMTKSVVVERPTANLVKTGSSPTAAKAAAGIDNPKVPPGKVRWHDNFAAACAASARSHKPVLLFHMMGKLDDQFC